MHLMRIFERKQDADFEEINMQILVPLDLISTFMNASFWLSYLTHFTFLRLSFEK